MTENATTPGGEAEWPLEARIALLRRLFLHVLRGGVLNERDLSHTEGAATPEQISEVIKRLETEAMAAAAGGVPSEPAADPVAR